MENEFHDYCKTKNITWFGHSIKDNYWSDENTCYRHQKSLTFADIKHYENENYTIVEFQGFDTIEKFDLTKHWEEFIGDKSKMIVNCRTEELSKEFLTFCEGKDCKWNTEIKLTTNNIGHWGDYKENTFYGGSNKNFWYNDCSQKYYFTQYKLVEFTGFNKTENKETNTEKFEKEYSSKWFPATTTKETIEVIYHRKETIVLIKTNGKYYKGVAKCHNEDTYDKEKGFMVAYQRARARENQQRLNTPMPKQEDLHNEEISLCKTCKHNSANSGLPCYDRWLEMGGSLNRYICWEQM